MAMWCYLFNNSFFCSEETRSAPEREGFFSTDDAYMQAVSRVVSSGFVSMIDYPTSVTDRTRFKVEIGNHKEVWQVRTENQAVGWVQDLCQQPYCPNRCTPPSSPLANSRLLSFATSGWWGDSKWSKILLMALLLGLCHICPCRPFHTGAQAISHAWSQLA